MGNIKEAMANPMREVQKEWERQSNISHKYENLRRITRQTKGRVIQKIRQNEESNQRYRESSSTH
jgi:hypothetical protein